MQQPKILVAIRKRPLSKKEQTKGETDIISVKGTDTVIVSQYKQKVDLTKYIEETIFNFDFAFHEETNNQEIYDSAVRPLVDSAFQGAKVTCFAYGQTGSGKTFTMNGVMSQGIRGLYTLGAQDIFDYLDSPQFKHLKARLSFFQIYCGKLYDLLNKRTELKLREDNKSNINIIGLQQAQVTSTQEFENYLAQGSKERVTSMNSANADSSRSHAILQITLKEGKKIFGKISFIDLAGNERGADHMDMNKQTRIDGAQINKSLLSLKECIRALDQGKSHTPFRGSKLTMVLKDSFVGFCRTVMIGNVSPSSASSQNTLNTLRYADRVKQLRKPTQGGNKQEMKAREMMLPRNNKNAIKIMINNDDDAEDIAGKMQEARKQYGIADQPKKNKEESVRKKPEVKSTSVAKNHASSLANKARDNPVRPSTKREETQATTLNRYNSNQYGVGKREEPMEIESGGNNYYMPNKNRGTSNNPRTTGQQNQSMNPSNNCSNLSMNSNMNMSQGRNNQFNPAYNPQYSQGYSQNSNYPQQGNYQGNYPQGNYPQQGNYNQGNFSQGNYQQNYPPNYQPQNNYNTPKNNNFFKPNPPQQIHYDLPENWEDMAAMVANSQDSEFRQEIIGQMNGKLLIQEEQLMKNHSDSLRREIDIIKEEMRQLNDMEVERGQITSRQYVQFMTDSIDEKISQLQELKQKMISFTYKLDTIEEIERSNKQMEIDEQLLDDIN